MKSMWIALVLSRGLSSSSAQNAYAVAERDVGGGVLVQQRVVEDGVERADAALAVDERDLAEAGRALVAARSRARRASAPWLGVDLHRAPALEAHPSAPRRSCPPSVERLRRAHHAVDPLRVGRGEDLLGGRLGMCADPVHGRRSSRTATSRSAAARRVRSVPGPSKCSAAKRRAVEPARDADERRPGARVQAATGSSSSSRQTCTICSHSCASAASGGRARDTPAAPSRRSGTGTIVQFVVRVVDHLAGLAQRTAAGRGRRAPGRARPAAPGPPGR